MTIRRFPSSKLNQRRAELTLSVIDKVLRADPTDAPAQRLLLKVLEAMPR